MTSTEPMQMAELAFEIDIQGSPSAVWEALTDDIARWWPADFFAGGFEGAKEFRLDARPGGLMEERWDGGGLRWGTVVTVERDRKLQLTGTSFPEWGGPAIELFTFVLEAIEGGTRLRFVENILGRVTEELLADNGKGWTYLLAALKAHIEGVEPPEWEE